MPLAVQLQHIDPLLAQLDAETAATKAFDRGRARSSAEVTLFPATRSPETKRPQDGLSRRRSVRFIGSCSVSGRQAMSRSDPLPSSRTVRHFDSIANLDTYATAQTEHASATDSLGRLRRSRSFASSVAGRDSRTAHGGIVPTSINSHLPLNGVTQPPVQMLRAPKSMSFLRTCRAGSIISRGGSVDVVSEFGGSPGGAGSQLRPSPPHSVTQTSSFFRYRSKRPDAPMRKSLRQTSSNSEPASITSMRASTIIVHKESGSLRRKAREVSKSLKTRFKSLLNLSRHTQENAGTPFQHIDAQRTHVFDGFDSALSSRGGNSEYEYNENGSCIHRVSSQVPYLHDIPSSQMLKSVQGSVESLHGEKPDDKSMVTSWTSCGPGTLVSQTPGHGDWERQRLSVIRESGSHAASPSLRRLGPLSVANTCQATSAQHQHGQLTPTHSPIDSQRVYSALMKRMNETRQLANIVEQQRKSSDGAQAPSCERKQCQTLGLKTLYTPRMLQCDGQQEEAEIRNPWALPTKEQEAVLPKRRPRSNSLEFSGSCENPIKNGEAVQNFRLPVPALQPSSAKSIAHRSSAFFGSPDRHLFRTESPYRRALQETIQAHVPVKRIPSSSLNSKADGLQSSGRESHDEMNEEPRKAYSDSLYSCTTDEEHQGVKKDEGVMLDGFSESPSRFAATSNVLSPACPLITPRVVSNVSSLDWKTSLASAVAKQEMSPAVALSGHDTAPMKSCGSPNVIKRYGRGHVREGAQIDTEDGPPFAAPAVPVRRPPRPAAALSIIEPNVVKTSPSQQSIKRSTSVLGARYAENEKPNLRIEESQVLQKSPLPPPIPPRSASRPGPGRSVADLKPKAASSTRETDSTPPQTPEKRVASAAARKSRSLARIRSLNKLRVTATGSPHSGNTPSPNKGDGMLGGDRVGAALMSAGASMLSTPDLTADVERQLSAAAAHVTKPPRPSRDGVDGIMFDKPDPYSLQSYIESDAEADGSRRVVDLVLSSRRRRMASSDEGGAFI
jgi:hypothetical protein